MRWFNYYGLAIMAIIMIPNVVYAVKCKNDGNGAYHNKVVEALEQIGRYGCFLFMICNIPYTYFGFWFDRALIVYLSVNGGLCSAYLINYPAPNAQQPPLRNRLRVFQSASFA